MANTLFDIAGEFLRLYEYGEDEEAFADTLESLEFDLAVKGAGYVNVMKQLEMEADKADEISKAFAKKAKARRSNIQKMKDRLQIVMQSIGKDKITAGEYTIVNKKNGGTPKLEYDASLVPDSFLKVSYEVDKAKVWDYLKDHDVPWARLLERGRHIEVN